MNNIAIHIEKLSKRYYIGTQQARYNTFRSAVSSWATAPFHKAYRLLKGQAYGAADLNQEIWALKDISVEIKTGEVVGIIGRNGAGKSTLLKVLSRITRPTSGYADIYGRIGALLEVGTGFHPELTGRENIHLNGAILGMLRSEIASKFDEIVDFSGVEKFIDTPVKHYSSGMHTRLAFAVAAHLDPEILVVDEVLAVGDATFQKKCLAKMQSVSNSGRTVLFVSHNMPTISRLCDRCLLLSDGRLISQGATHDVVAEYLQSDSGMTAHRTWPNQSKAPGNDKVKLRSVRIIDDSLQTKTVVDIRHTLGIELTFDILEKVESIVPAITLFNDQGVDVLNALDTNSYWHTTPAQGSYTSIAWIPANLLNEGQLIVNVALMDVQKFVNKPFKYVFESDVVSFQVVDSEEGPSAKGIYQQHWPSAIYPLLNWQLNHSQKDDPVNHERKI